MAAADGDAVAAMANNDAQIRREVNQKLKTNSMQKLASNTNTVGANVNRAPTKSDILLGGHSPNNTNFVGAHDCALGGLYYGRNHAPLHGCATNSFYYENSILTLDLHGRTEDESWGLIMELFATAGRRAGTDSGARGGRNEKTANRAKTGSQSRVRVITGASGILRVKFEDWITRGILGEEISSWTMPNRGCFEVILKK